MAITIRTAAVEDVPRITVLLGQLGYPTDETRVRTRVDTWLADPRSALLVAEVDGRVMGVAAMHAMQLLEYDGSQGRLAALVVDDSCRGQGVGRELVAEAEQQARGLGCWRMEVTSSLKRDGSHHFYRAIGYEGANDKSARYLKPLG
ncbi:GNAT family N-acetyltransferase [Kutzneria sp. NPDC052558]|uniref:GNAT family N-acetyltransferase n=1 Tax=Kutzneria sp. NPDC052558 TaxID=3364121 RepID=UPI0037C98C93